MNCKRSIALIVLMLMYLASWSQQRPVYIYRNAKDSLQNFYTVRQPADKVKGAIVLISTGLSEAAKKAAYEKGVLLMTAVLTDNDLDFLMDDLLLKRLDSMINEAAIKYQIPAGKIVIGGMSAAGATAVRFAEYCARNESAFKIMPVAVFAADPPLDYERLYNESESSVLRNYNDDAVTEGKQLMALFKSKLKGSPGENRNAYERVSPFSHTKEHGGNAAVLKDMHVRMYSEPDINWWINNRGKDFYDINVLDIAAFINQLRLLGNKNAELIATDNKGYRKDGSRHPHSWSIVDDVALLEWSIRLFETR
ncbi:hypothetical protein [Chitinophaga sp. S165]|uniref:hypothetical protein n=1 Tax=Chitinophaga sp. S165 TaxID=2135462 RepID=UPI000D85E478|nr:hypothetical protein [Chitinophaga sp. S165]PWV46111.1 hypothetical protein C7475_11113 [Chitinophaga sp. S165]